MKKNILVIIASVIFSIILWISVSLSSEYFYTFNVPIKIINFPEGYTSGSKMPDHVSIKVKGKGWNLITLSLKTDMIFYISAGMETGNRTVYTQSSLAENNLFSSDIQVVNIKPDAISFFIEKMGQKKVKIVPDVVIDFKNTFGLASPISVTPESTIVYGPKSILRNLNEITTQKMYYYKTDKRISENVPLQPHNGFAYMNEKVMLNIDVQQIVEKTLDGVLVEVKDVPKGEEVILIPNKITIGLRGGIDILGKLSPENMAPFVRYEELINNNDGVVTPHILTGPYIKDLYIKPNEIKYIIKKF